MPRPFVVGLIGTAVVLAYAVFAAIQILVLNPLAAVPGLTLGEVRAELGAAGETIDVMGVLVTLAIGPLLAVAFALSGLSRAASPAGIAIGQLGVLVCGAPAYFTASFGPGMALADGFGISGGDHSSWSALLYVVSLIALVGIATIAIADARRRSAALSRQVPVGAAQG
jgi:hypothetical protein